jgi:hypothetical protein
MPFSRSASMQSSLVPTAPNDASFAVMRRLGMRFHKNVQYSLGTGAEYILHRDDPAPKPEPTLIPLD